MDRSGKAKTERCGTYILTQSQAEQGQKPQILAQAELRTCPGRSRHLRLVSREDIYDLIEDCVPSVFELVVGLYPFHSFLGQEIGDGDLISGRIHLRDAAGGRQGQGHNANSSLTYMRVSHAENLTASQ